MLNFVLEVEINLHAQGNFEYDCQVTKLVTICLLLCPVGSHFSILHGLGKAHKQLSSLIYLWIRQSTSSDKNCSLFLNKDQFKCLLTLATKKSDFLFDGELYRSVDCIAMGSPLGPILANISLCHYEDIWLRNCSLECKSSYYKRYVDDIFVLFESEIRVQSFKNFMNTCHPKMKFTFEKEQNNCFNF